jgi:hypothetical protein
MEWTIDERRTTTGNIGLAIVGLKEVFEHLEFY